MSDETKNLLQDKSVLVTGAAGGIGRAMAERFAAEGASVLVADIDSTGGAETVDLLRGNGAQAEFVACDVTSRTDTEGAVAATVEAFGSLDCAANNAGWEGAPATLADYDEGAWNKLIGVNLTGVFLSLQAELRQMLKQGSGTIVNTSSISGFIGQPEFGPYNASKAGVLGLTKAAAMETATSGIRVNAVAPGFVNTEMVIRVGGEPGSEIRKAAEEAHPMNRLAEPEEIAAAAAWLLSDESAFVTGHPLVVDGGFLAR